jgi:hypothetical protein
MNDARAGGLHAVRSSLRILVYCSAAAAAIELVDRIGFDYLFDRLNAGTLHDYSLIGAMSTIESAITIALSLTIATAVRGLGALPLRLAVAPKPAAAKAQPYRAPSADETAPTPTVETAPGVYALARWASVSAWGVLCLAVAVLAWDSLATALQIKHHTGDDALHVVERALWALSIAAAVLASGLLVLWMIRVAQSLAQPLRAPLPVIVLALVAGRGAFWTSRMFSHFTYPWVGTAFTVAIGAGTALILVAFERGLAALPPQEAGDAGPDRDGETRWEEAGLGLERHASAVKARIGIGVGGVGLMLLAKLAEERDVALGLAVLAPLAALLVGVVMIGALVRYARLPGDTRAGGLAMAAVGLLAAAWLADVYGFQLVIDLLGHTFYTSAETTARMPHVEIASAALGLAGMLALLASFGRLSASMGEQSLVSRSWALALLLCITAAGATGLRLAVADGEIGVAEMLAGGLVVLVLGIVALLKYLGLILDLRVVMSRRTARKFV